MNNEIKEKNLNQAAYELSDELLEVNDKLENAYLILTETTNYFEKYDVNDKEDVSAIIFEFPKNERFANIAMDYVLEAKDIMDKLMERATEAQKSKKNLA
jgi:hypothetical protein